MPIVALVVVAMLCSEVARAQTYDLVIANGRVMDPESGLDAIRQVGIRAGRVAAISQTPLSGTRVIDATGFVVAPGFIDLHEHGQQEESYMLMVRDGVTSAFELEVGTADVAAWYAARDPGQIVNYGVSVGHIPVRMRVLRDPGTFLPAGIGGSGRATEPQIAEMERLLVRGLAEGAVAVGFGSAYTPGATMAEIERLFRVAPNAGASIHIHMRSGLAGLDSTIAAAARAGAGLHVVHVNSSGDTLLPAFLSRIQAARDRGQDVTTEAYPYGAGMTEIQSALFDDWRSWPDARFALHQLVSTGRRLDRRSFEEARRTGGTVIIHGRTEAQTRTAIVSPLTMIASDGFIERGRGHPRTSGSYSKVLGKYVREERALSLMDALRKMTLAPARRLEARVPAMRSKGRVRVGADADLTIFDPAAVIDRATYEDATIPAAGIPYVVIGGEIAVDGGQVTRARAGRAIRAPAQQSPRPYFVGNRLGLPINPEADGSFEPISSSVKVYGAIYSAESCSYDADRGLIVVPNRGVPQRVQGNNAWVSLMNHDGSVHTARWIGVQGPDDRANLTPPLVLNEPFGSDIARGMLYVADRDGGTNAADTAVAVIRWFDMRTGAPVGEIRVPQSTGFNDIEVADDGTIYATQTGDRGDGQDPATWQLWKITPDGTASIFAQGAPLFQPNGVALDPQGNIVVVNVGDAAILTFSPTGRLLRTEAAAQAGSDGLVIMSDGTKYVSSVIHGGISRIRQGQRAELIARNIPNAASMCYDSGANQLVIPMNANNALAFVPLP